MDGLAPSRQGLEGGPKNSERLWSDWDHPRLGPAEQVSLGPPGINHSWKSGLPACLPGLLSCLGMSQSR